MNAMPDYLPDDPDLLKQMLVRMLCERQVDKDQIVVLKEQIKDGSLRLQIVAPKIG